MHRLTFLFAVSMFAMGCAPSMTDARGPYEASPPPNDAASTSMRAPNGAPMPFEMGQATWYGRGLEGHPTASGEPFDPNGFTAAHKTLPLGSIVDVVRSDGRIVRVRINDRGPYVDGRIVDLSPRSAAQIGLLRDGVANVALYVVWVAPPRAKHGRRASKLAANDE